MFAGLARKFSSSSPRSTLFVQAWELQVIAAILATQLGLATDMHVGNLGTMSGLGTFFKDAKPSVFRLGYVIILFRPCLMSIYLTKDS